MERHKSLGLSNSSDNIDEKQGEIIHHRLSLNNGIESRLSLTIFSSQHLSVA